MVKIAIGADHRGYAMKNALVEALRKSGYEVRDFGPTSTKSVDYPDTAKDVAEAVSDGETERGILICSNGIGMSIAANKVEGVRAALCYDVQNAKQARQHNNANILCMGGETTSQATAKELVKAFLETSWDGATKGGERHAIRVAKIARLERQAKRVR
ncbi:MAG: ribose 5-phosphate isomerase B [Dehalococcoidia bacterium]|nr:ribose 5-phosphate isomerase B [Dehalococcoidia bacterium]